jgi:hypothetical protein
MDELPDEVAAALASSLDPAEKVEMTLPAVGCTLVLTDRQLLMVRQGAHYRPRTGVTSWQRDTLGAHLQGDRRGGLRFVVDSRPRLSAFIPSNQAHAARALVAAIRGPGSPED